MNFLKSQLDALPWLLFNTGESYYGWAVLKPQAKQSTQFAGRKKGKKGFISGKKEQYVQELVAQFKSTWKGQVFSGPLIAIFMYAFSWPKNEWGIMLYRDRRPDLDNLFKPAQDALEEFLFDDDSHIVIELGVKVWAETPTVGVKVSKILA